MLEEDLVIDHTVFESCVPLAFGLPVVRDEFGIDVGIQLNIVRCFIIARSCQGQITVWQCLPNEVFWGNGR